MAGRLYDTVIVGSGVVGYAAALHASRAGLSTLLFQGFEMGGRLMLVPMVEDYPGFEEGIPGQDLMDKFEEHTRRSGADIRPDDVRRVDLSEYPFELWGAEEESVSGRTVILATGVRGKELGVGGELRLMGRGVSTSALCDAFLFKDKKVAVVGGGDRAMEEALFLLRYASEVTIIQRQEDCWAASWIMLDKAQNEPRIYFVTGVVVEEVLGENSVEGVRVREVKTGGKREIGLDGIFVAIGEEPRSELFEGLLDIDEDGYIVRHEYTMTSVSGVFSAGGVSDRRYHRAVTAAGEGFMAAVDAERWLRR